MIYVFFYCTVHLSYNNILLKHNQQQYTAGLAVFDALGVDLVHGWISDPRDDMTYQALLGKSYNQLTDLVIKGGEASDEIQRLLEAIQKKTTELCSSQNIEMKEMNPNLDWVDISKELDMVEISSSPDADKKDSMSASNVLPCGEDIDQESQEDGKRNHQEKEQNSTTSCTSTSTELVDNPQVPCPTDSNKLIEEISYLQEELKRNQEVETMGHVIRNFLNDTSHQLTIYGLEKLHDYISDGQFCVFFRNNHFSTITKHNGHLFLLVTDLGYANVNEVVWEKLDDINGDTDYADCEFKKPKPRSTLTPTAPVLSPDLVLTQQQQQDRDFQLAVRLSEGKALDDAALDEEEAALVEAAKELSLHSYNDIGTNDWSDLKPEASTTRPAGDNTNATTAEQQQDNADYKLALQLQQQQNMMMPSLVISDEALARQLDAEERIAAASERRNPRPNTRNNNTPRSARAESKSHCTIS